MAKFTLEWRQLEQDEAGAWFAHRLAYADNGAAVQELAEAVGDRAWAREFRLLRGDRETFTDLHSIQDWRPEDTEVPRPARRHVWRRDLQRDLVADTFIGSVRSAVQPAVAADVLLRADGDALLRFALASLRRPRL